MSRLLPLALFLATAGPAALAENAVYPRPQQSHFTQGNVRATEVVVEQRTQESRGGVWVKLPSGKTGAYALSIQADGKVHVYANDEVGVFYAKQTLIQLLEGVAGTQDAQKDPFPDATLEQVAAMGELPVGELMDWPDLPYRGMVEGYYGRPWSSEEICNQMDFFGRNKMNIFIYAPKDDPYHHGEGCYKPYPEEKAKELAALVERAKRNHVRFVWAIHPANTVKWHKNGGKDELDGLCRKLELMYELGFRDFAVLVDDSSGEIGRAERQAELTNYILNNFIRKHPDVNQELIMCPTGYNRAWTSEKFLRTLGDALDPAVHVMWTGDTVVHDITLAGQKWVHGQTKRPTFIWWNWPCTDYKRSRLSMGRTYGLDTSPEMLMEMSGFVANPMEHAESSKVGLFGVADYTWNITGFQSEQNWKDGIQRLFPGVSEEMQVFCKHNSYLLPNYHKYVREESVDLAPITKEYTAALVEGRDPEPATEQALRQELGAIAHAGEKLYTAPEAATLRSEIGPWLRKFHLLGQIGLNTMDTLHAKDDAEAQAKFFAAMDSVAESKFLTRNQWAPDGGTTRVRDVEVSRLVVYPVVSTAFDWAGKQIYAGIAGRDIMWPNPVFTCQGGNTARGTEFITDGLLDTNWGCGQQPKAGDWYCFDFGGVAEVKTLSLTMGGNGNHYPAKGQFEYTLDGKEWLPLGGPSYGRVAVKDMGDSPVKATMVRYRVLKQGPGWVAINEFTINKPLPAVAATTIRGLEGIYVGKTQQGYSVANSLEVHTAHSGDSIELQLPTAGNVTALVIDLGNEQIQKWAEVRLELEDGSETTLAMQKEGKTTLYAEGSDLPKQGIKTIKVVNVSQEDKEIKLNAFAISLPSADPYADPDNLTDVDFATFCDAEQGFTATITIPKDAKEAIVVGHGECTLNGAGCKQKGTHLQVFDIAPGTRRAKLEVQPASGARIHEVIFR